MEQANMENQGVRLGDGPSETETRAISGVPPEGVGVRNRCGLGRRCVGLEHSRAIDSRITRKQYYYALLYFTSFPGWRTKFFPDAQGSEPKGQSENKTLQFAKGDSYATK